MATVREGPAAESDVERVGGEADSELDQIDRLIGLAEGVLRALAAAEPGSARLEVSAGVHADVDLERARKAAPTLHALLGVLRDAVGGTQLVPVTNGGTSRAAAALSDLLATVLVAPATTGDGASAEPDTEVFDHAVAEADSAAEALEHDAGWGLEDTESPDSRDKWALINLTPHRLDLRRRDGVWWVLPAYGKRRMKRDPRAEFDLAAAVGEGKIFVCEEPDPTPVDYSPLALWVFAIPIGAAIGASQGTWAAVLGGMIAFGLPLVWFLAGAVRSEAKWWEFMRDLPGRAVQAATFLVVLGFCLAVPAATLYYGADLKPVISEIWDGDGDRVDYLTVVCRTMQLVLIAVASMLPALLYYQFDRDRLSTLRERFEHQIFRLDRTMRTSRDIDAKYGKQIDEIYGPARSGRSGKLPRGRRAPIFVATPNHASGKTNAISPPSTDAHVP